MNTLYLILDLGSISVPLLYSIFEKKLHFIQYIKPLSVAMFITAFVFIVWDIWFTKIGVWGFNPTYLLGVDVLHLPIEEWLFFLCIPYASIFTHEVLKYFFPTIGVGPKFGAVLTILLVIGAILISAVNYNKWYTALDFSFFALLLIIGYIINRKELFRFYITYLVVLIPFFIVNGILTGSLIENEVVWYNNTENLVIRLGTIPVEDVFYGFSMIFMSILIFQQFRKKYD